jgi:hypothetical protein
MIHISSDYYGPMGKAAPAFEVDPTSEGLRKSDTILSFKTNQCFSTELA